MGVSDLSEIWKSLFLCSLVCSAWIGGKFYERHYYL